MPTLDAPGYFEHSKSIMPDKFDTFFKWAASTVDATYQTGDVSSPMGVVTLVKVDEWTAAEFIVDTKLDEDWPGFGWYVTREDDNGLIWAMSYGDLDSTLAEEGARADYAEADHYYQLWMES